MSNCWWVVATKEPDNWTWDNFFSDPNNPKNWSWGQGEIESRISLKHIEEMQEKDIVICYQGGKGIVGFTFIAHGGYSYKNRGKIDTFDLTNHIESIIKLKKPIPCSVIRKLPRAEDKFEFIKINLGTVFIVTAEGLDDVIYLAEKYNPNKKIKEFLEAHRLTPV